MITAFLKYARKYLGNGQQRRVAATANFFWPVAVLRKRKMNRIPMNKRAIVACVLTAFSILYGVLPTDLIPDATPRGMVDDVLLMTVCTLAAAAVVKHGRTLRKLILVRATS